MDAADLVLSGDGRLQERVGSVAGVETFDHVVVGAGSAGCAATFRLAESGSVCVIEAGPSERHPLVAIPLGLVFLMGSRRDWRRRSASQAALGGRTIAVPRGRMVGGSGSINSMVWYRGRADDWDGWAMSDWSWREMDRVFEAVEGHVRPARLPDPHPLSEAFGRLAGGNDPSASPTPERESAGVHHVNMERGRRRSAADAFLRPAMARGRVRLVTNASVDHVVVEAGRAAGVVLRDGRRLDAQANVVLSAGAVETPMVLMRSGLGPADALRHHGIVVVRDLPSVGVNLHDHPGVGLHFRGGPGYGLTLRQAAHWLAAPLLWTFARRGRLTSNTVEAGAFWRVSSGDGPPEVQTHFIPFLLDPAGRRAATGTGFFADICLCRPRSRGHLTMMDRDTPSIDPGLLTDPADLDVMVRGIERLRGELARLHVADAGEVVPGGHVTGAALRDDIRARCGTAYHPVGTVALGGPLDAHGRIRGVEGLWVADASVMPRITSANTNAPSMAIGWRIGGWAARP